MAQNLYIYFCLEKIYDIKESMNFRFIRVTFSKFLKQVVEHILGSCVILFLYISDTLLLHRNTCKS